MTPNFGEQVPVSKRLVRQYIPRDGLNPPRKEWAEEEISPPVTGLYIGWRTLANGVYMPGSFEDPSYLKADQHIRVALVVLGERSNPIYVPWSEVV